MGRRGGRLVAIVGLIGATLAVVPAADARLRGNTEIRKVLLLRTTEGADAGQHFVWVRVHHGLAQGKAADDATHRGRVRVELEGAGKNVVRKSSTPLLVDGNEHLDKHRAGYLARLPDSALKASSDSTKVSVDASQRLDLDGDGDAESQETDHEVVPQKIKPIPEILFPSGTHFSNFTDPVGGEFDADIDLYFAQSQVEQVGFIAGKVVKVFQPGRPGYACIIGDDDNGQTDGLINPVTGAFFFTFQDGNIRGRVSADGTFTADMSGVTGTKTSDFGGGPCPPVDLTGLQFAPAND